MRMVPLTNFCLFKPKVNKFFIINSTGEGVEQPAHRALLVLGVEGRDELALRRPHVRARHGGIPLRGAGTHEDSRTSGSC